MAPIGTLLSPEVRPAIQCLKMDTLTTRKQPIQDHTKDATPHVPDFSSALPTLSAKDDTNILVITDIRSGKSSLIEAMKLYAKPVSEAQPKVVARGRNGTTDDILQKTTFLSNLQAVEIRKRKGIKGLRTIMETITNFEIVSKEAARSESQTIFEALLHLSPEWASTRDIETTVSKKYRFKVFEASNLQEDYDNLQESWPFIGHSSSPTGKCTKFL
ncbi:hypothetical protein BGZ52_009680 [Haplosporangium bisporale]|nr:hypothetical protein BGZ52_009680 [Haplosporangium bisporale]